MSIAVMNWVWANSPTSGNGRLVLLALADACSRDDGTGCWPSAATSRRQLLRDSGGTMLDMNVSPTRSNGSPILHQQFC